MFGTLTVYEVEKDYNILLALLNDILDLSDDFKEEMTTLIKQKIDDIPKVENEKQEELKEYEEDFKTAKPNQKIQKEIEEMSQRFKINNLVEKGLVLKKNKNYYNSYFYFD